MVVGEGGVEGARAAGSGAAGTRGRERVAAVAAVRLRQGARGGGGAGAEEGVGAVAGAGPAVEVALVRGACGEPVLASGPGRGRGGCLVLFGDGADARSGGGAVGGARAGRLREAVGFRYGAFALLVVARAAFAGGPCASWIPD